LLIGNKTEVQVLLSGSLSRDFLMPNAWKAELMHGRTKSIHLWLATKLNQMMAIVTKISLRMDQKKTIPISTII
ncbi:uncharacterized protein METZ01_LOCUS142133, partial [marine metagenome]